VLVAPRSCTLLSLSAIQYKPSALSSTLFYFFLCDWKSPPRRHWTIPPTGSGDRSDAQSIQIRFANTSSQFPATVRRTGSWPGSPPRPSLHPLILASTGINRIGQVALRSLAPERVTSACNTSWLDLAVSPDPLRGCLPLAKAQLASVLSLSHGLQSPWNECCADTYNFAVLSFMSQWGVPPRSPNSDADGSPSSNSSQQAQPRSNDNSNAPITPSGSSLHLDQQLRSSPTSAQQQRTSSRQGSRPASMVQTYQPPLMEVAQDTLYVQLCSWFFSKRD